MIPLKLSEIQLDDLYEGMSSNANLRARKKCLIVYLRAKGYPCHEIADIVRVDENTVTKAVKKYMQGGLPCLLKEGYRKPKSQLDRYSARLKELFEKQPLIRSTRPWKLFLKKRRFA